MLKQEQVTRKKFNKLKKYYDETWDTKNQTLHVGIFDNKHKTLLSSYKNATHILIKKINAIRKIDKKSSVLDVGCGTGRTLIEICKKYNCQGVGVDISDEQIKDAKKYLASINLERVNKKQPRLKCKFIHGSGSGLDKIFKQDERFNYIISQDSLFLVVNKKSLFKNLYKLLSPNGILGIADFLSYSKKSQLSKDQQKLVYRLVNWNEGLSFNEYQTILESVGFKIIEAKERNKDMIKTYTLLVEYLTEYINREDKIYKELFDRYKNIASAVKSKKMGWALFFAVKEERKSKFYWLEQKNQ